MSQRIESGSGTQVEPEVQRYRVLVDPITPLEEQCAQAGFLLEDIRAEIRNWGNLGNIPGEPYWAEISDGSKTEGLTWEKAMKGISKEERPTTILEGIALAKAKPEILDCRRLALPATSHDLYDIMKIEKGEDGKIRVRPLFVGDTNADHKTNPPTNLPFAVIFTKK